MAQKWRRLVCYKDQNFNDFQQESSLFVGCGASTLYHSVLERIDTILLEKCTMTCGSTWYTLATFFHRGSGLTNSSIFM